MLNMDLRLASRMDFDGCSKLRPPEAAGRLDLGARKAIDAVGGDRGLMNAGREK